MSDAATTVGSIEGKLGLDITDWVRKIDEAKAKAHELEDGKPTLAIEASTTGVDRAIEKVEAEADHIDGRTARVRVTADTAGASVGLVTVKEKVDAVAAAEAKLAAVQSAWSRATNQATLAEMRLEEVRGRRSTTLQVATAEEAYRYAEERSTTAAEKLVAAEAAVVEARQKATESAVEEAAADDVAAKSTANATGRTQALALAILGLGPGLIPLAAGAVGYTAALAGMGGAGVLAFLGIRSEMAQGTVQGQVYADMLAGLRADAHELETTAAGGVLSGASTAAGELQDAMPTLNREVATFSDQLGRILPTGLDAVLTMLTRAEPLLNRSGEDLVGFVNGIDDFAHSQQFEAFIQYALANLPQVEHLIEDAFTFVTHFLAAMGPYGTVVMGIVDDALKLGTALSPIVPAIWAVVTALTAMSVGSRILDGLTTGMARLGITAQTTAEEVATAEAAAGGGAALGKGLLGIGAAAGLAGGMALGDSQETIAPNTNQPGSLKVTPKLLAYQAGIDGAKGGRTTGSQDAWMTAQLGKGNAGAAADSFDAIKKAAADMNVPVSQLAKLYPTYTRELAAATGANHSQATSVVTVADAYKSLVAQEQAAYTKQAALAQQNQSLEGTNDAAKDALAGLDKQLAKGSTSLNVNTAAGRQNREAILSVVTAAQQHASAINADGKHAAEAAVYTDQFALSLEKNLIKMGMSKSAADAYIKTLLGMPKSASLTVALRNAQAEAYLDSIRSKMNNLNGTAATVYVNAVASGVSTGVAAQTARNAAQFGRKAGGTIGMAAGGTPYFEGTVSGPGNAAADLAGRYNLANGEEVTSDLYGQASTFRPVLKAINSQQVRTMGDLAALLGAQGRGPITQKTVNLGGVHMHNPVAVDPVQSAEDTSQIIAAYAGYPL